MSEAGDFRAILFDVFGTVVDLQGGLVRDLTAWMAAHNLVVDSEALAAVWIGGYASSVSNGVNPWIDLETLLRKLLRGLIPEFGLNSLRPEDITELTNLWRRLPPWADL